MPADNEKRLDELIATSQFAALRQLHAAMRSAGESPEVLGALIRAYANLGVLTEHLWLGGHRIFKARALLYAERLRQRLPKDPRGLWHRAYAETLIGLHREALDDLRAAADLAAGAASPEWVALLEPCCRFDADQLAKLADKPKLAQLARLLHFLVVEHRHTLRLCLDSAQAILKENPDCTRVLDALCDIGGVGVPHQVTEGYLEILSQIVPGRVAGLPGLPEALAAKLRDAKSQVDFQQALLDEGSRDADEPTWSTLGRILQEEHFTSIWRRVDFMRYQWGVPVDKFVAAAVDMLKDHPYRDLIRSYSVDPQRDPASYKKIVENLPTDNVDFSYGGLIRALSKSGSDKWSVVHQRALRQMDEDYRDLGVYLRSMNRGSTGLEIARRLVKVSPHAGIALATLLELSAPPEQAVTDWETDEGHQAIVLRGLAQLYSQRKRDADADRCWKAYLKRSPDFVGYRGLADLYKRQGKSDQWKATLDEYLQQGEQDLQHARVRVDIAEQLMADKKWREAKPYADEAAQTGAAWTMLCANKCYEGLGQWDEAEQWVRRTAERYPNNTFAWFFWCWRTGKGDARAARQMVEKYIQAQGGQLSPNDTSHIGVFYTITGQRAKAFSYLKAMYERSKNAPASMFYALACDDAGDKKERDRIWTLFPAADPVYTQLARLFRQCLERGEKSDVDAEEVQKILAKASPALQADACYFVGDFLSCRGKRQTANGYLDRCATTSVGNPYIRLLAIARLREQKIEPGTLNKGGKNES